MEGDTGTLISFTLSLSTFQYENIQYSSPTPLPPPVLRPTSHPTPFPPSPSPTPYSPYFCCVYKKIQDYQCLTLTHTCPALVGWLIESSEEVQYDRECHRYCPLPTPSPSPSPSPTPFLPFRCCLYDSERDGRQCFHFTSSHCPPFIGYHLVFFKYRSLNLSNYISHPHPPTHPHSFTHAHALLPVYYNIYLPLSLILSFFTGSTLVDDLPLTADECAFACHPQ